VISYAQVSKVPLTWPVLKGGEGSVGGDLGARGDNRFHPR